MGRERMPDDLDAIARRDFLRLGALFVPLPAEPQRAYSFLRASSLDPAKAAAIAGARAALDSLVRLGWVSPCEASLARVVVGVARCGRFDVARL